MREIKHIVVHCSATDGKTTRAETILKNAKEKGEINPPYHKVIDWNGKTTTFAEDDIICNGVKGHNKDSLHVCYTGGTNDEDTRTIAQKTTLFDVLKNWKQKYPTASILGHRDFEGVKKSCPCFDAKTEYNQILSK